jgi:hypothetical protein
MPYSKYLPEQMGSINLSPSGPFIAGSYAELVLVYTAGTFGIDDTGMLKVSWRTTSDFSKPQFAKPDAPNFTTVEASNGAKLEVWFDRLNIRPYANTLLIRIGRGYLQAGDTLTIRMGDRRLGSPGLRLQTNVEKNVELRTSVDAFATYEFCELLKQPAFAMPTSNTLTTGVSSALSRCIRAGARLNGYCMTRLRRAFALASFATATTIRDAPVRRCPVHQHLGRSVGCLAILCRSYRAMRCLTRCENVGITAPRERVCILMSAVSSTRTSPDFLKTQNLVPRRNFQCVKP